MESQIDNNNEDAIQQEKSQEEEGISVPKTGEKRPPKRKKTQSGRQKSDVGKHFTK